MGVRSRLQTGAVLTSALALTGCYFDFSAADAGAQPGDDSGTSDGGPGEPDAAVADAGPTADAAPEFDAWVPYTPQYSTLSETGLYEDITTQIVADDVLEFEPVYWLWSDAADKTRWLRLPPGTQINTIDMDHWQFPPGTKVWKLFTHETEDGTILLETRLIERTGPSQSDRYMMSFQWRSECFDGDPGNDDLCDADAVPGGVIDANGTDHNIPAASVCIECHGGERNQILGFGAVQLSYDQSPATCTSNPGSACPTLASLEADGLLTDPPDPAGYPVPGTGTTQEALGYLHANCGHCHNPGPANATGCYLVTGGSGNDGIEGFHARIYTAESGGNPQDTAAWVTTFGLDGCGYDLQAWVDGDAPGINPSCTETSPDEWECTMTKRGVMGSSADSAVHYRIANRGFGIQMPPLATEFVDDDGAQLIADWIDAQVEPGGCP